MGTGFLGFKLSELRGQAILEALGVCCGRSLRWPKPPGVHRLPLGRNVASQNLEYSAPSLELAQYSQEASSC